MSRYWRSIEEVATIVRRGMPIALCMCIATFIMSALVLLVLMYPYLPLSEQREPSPTLLVLARIVSVALAASWTGCIGWLFGEACWRARRDMSAPSPTMAGRRRAALLGVGFAGASLLVLPLLFIAHALWLAIPLTMIEGRALPDALGRARWLAARHRRALLIDQARLALCGAPIGLGLWLMYRAESFFHGEWSGLAVVPFWIMVGVVTALYASMWVTLCACLLYNRYGLAEARPKAIEFGWDDDLDAQR